jgi:hypothetical protein
MHFIDRQAAITALLILVVGYALRSRALFALFHLLRAAELMRLWHYVK